MMAADLQDVLKCGGRDAAGDAAGECADRHGELQIAAEIAVQKCDNQEIGRPSDNDSGGRKAPIVGDLENDHNILEKDEETLAVGAEWSVDMVIEREGVCGYQELECKLRQSNALRALIFRNFENLRKLEPDSAKDNDRTEQFADIVKVSVRDHVFSELACRE